MLTKTRNLTLWKNRNVLENTEYFAKSQTSEREGTPEVILDLKIKNVLENSDGG